MAASSALGLAIAAWSSGRFSGRHERWERAMAENLCFSQLSHPLIKTATWNPNNQFKVDGHGDVQPFPI